MTISSLSMAHGPAMRTKGRVPPILNFPETEISLVDVIVVWIWIQRRFKGILSSEKIGYLYNKFSRSNRMSTNIQDILKHRILVLDGATGTMIQTFGLTEKDFRGDRFTDFPKNLKGHNDLLCLTKPEVISQIHAAYLQAGAAIIEPNSFNANAISLADYDMSPLAYEINLAAAQLARKAADEQ